MSETLIRIIPARYVTLPGVGLLDHIDVAAALIDCLEVSVYAQGAGHRGTHLIESTPADGETTWYTDDENDAPVPVWLCRQINTAIKCAAVTLAALADLDTEEVAR